MEKYRKLLCIMEQHSFSFGVLILISGCCSFVRPEAIFHSENLTSPYPNLGNGHIATTVFDQFIYVQGLYGGSKENNHRIGIPSPLSVRIDRNLPSDAQINYTMNMDKAFFEVNVVQDSHSTQQRIYCHARIPELAVMQVRLQRNTSIAKLVSPVDSGYVPTLNPDIRPSENNARLRMAARNPVVECFVGNFTGRNGTGNICLVYDAINNTFILEKNTLNLTETYLVVIHPSKQTALEIYYRARNEISSGVLWARHKDAWRKRWSDGKVTFVPISQNGTADKWTRLAHSSLYYLLSSVPRLSHSNHFVGLSNDGLSGTMDKGRIRSEQELFMFPALLLLQSDAARLIIDSRMRMISQTMNASGGAYRGAKYPFETSVNGEELFVNQQPGREPDRTRALYVSGAVAFAVQNYFYATARNQVGNAGALRDFAVAVAQFYEKLVQNNGTISGVVGIDPYNSTLTSNHALTNTLAYLSLNLPYQIQKSFFPHEDVPRHILQFLEVAKNISTQYPYIKERTGNRTAHAKDDLSASISQGLAGDFRMEADLLLNYLPVQYRSFLSSGFVERDWIFHGYNRSSKSSYVLLKEAIAVFANLNTSGRLASTERVSELINYSADHFGIIPTYFNHIDGLPSSVETHPDLPAHGTFLQLILNGYGGFQLLSDRLIINPQIPDGISSWSVVGVDYQGFALTFNFTLTDVHIRAVPNLAAYPETRLLYLRTSLISLPINNNISVKRSRIEIMANLTSENHWSRSAYLLESNSLPDEKFMPEIGNGHIATAIYNKYIHMNGLYNGEGTASSRARIPSLLNFHVEAKGEVVNETFVLNLREGIFTETTHYRNPSLSIRREFFAHRQFHNLMLSRIVIKRLSRQIEDIEVSLTGLILNATLDTPDINFANWSIIPEISSPKDCQFASGKTTTPEQAKGQLLPMTVAFCSSQKLEESLTLRPSEEELHIQLIIAVDSNEETAIKSVMDADKQTFEDLRASHVEKWRWYWDNGRVEVDPDENLELAQALHGSFYYLLSSLPNHDIPNSSFVGMSPGGLAHGAPGRDIDQDYLGHSFWDTELWMFPPILFFHPNLASLLIQARIRQLPQAKENARISGLAGAKYPWESALTGIETTPWPPASIYQIHINGDIAYAVRQFLYATNDQSKVIREMGLDNIVIQLAKFWESRVTYDINGQCSINEVMGPDEYHYPVNNSAYTNHVARISLLLPEYVLKLIKREDLLLPTWKEIAGKISIAESVHGNRPYHPQFDGFLPGGVHFTNADENQMVKQADVILLGYPLDMEMTKEMRQNDLEIYENITNPRGPAMTFGMFAIGYLEVNQKRKADQMFNKYIENIQHPFGVWSETPGGEGAVNFLTGMGGFLQSVINGYGGFRLRSDHLLFDPAQLPQTSHWNISGMKYLENQIDFMFDFDKNTIGVKVTSQKEYVPLVVETSSGIIYRLYVGQLVSYDRERSKIRRYRVASDVITDPQTGLVVTASPIAGTQPLSSSLFPMLSAFLFSFLIL